jgi:twitching motility protein PilT
VEAISPAPEIRQKIAQGLGKTPLFKGVKAEIQQHILDTAKLLRFVKGETIIRQGQASDAFYLLLLGRLKVWVNADEGGEAVEVGEVNPLEEFGETGLLLGSPRTATVVAHQDSLLMCLAKSTFEQMFERFPSFGVEISRALAQRLTFTSRQVQLNKTTQHVPPDAETLSILPLALIERHRVLPLKIEGTLLTLGCVDDVNPAVILRLKNLLPSMEFRPLMIPREFFQQVLAQVSGLGVAANKAEPNQPKVSVEKASPLLAKLLKRVVAEGASDLHLCAGLRPRWRLDGSVMDLKDAPELGPKDVFGWLRPLMRAETITEFEESNDADFAIALGSEARFRVNLFADQGGIGAVLRQIPTKILTADQLGLPPIVLSLCEQPKGLILVTGPTGSGKSTTLAAMIDHINRTQSQHIITLEDPVEFVHPSQNCLVNQREIGTHTRDFSRALRAALRQDPDIILVGELRDLETISLALEVANTGHLVFGTLHTATAITTVDRIVDIFPAEQQNQIRSGLAEVLLAVVAQTLCKKKGGGRVAALETLIVNRAISSLIRGGKTSQFSTIMQTGKALGNCLLNEALARLVKDGRVDYDEAHTKALDKTDLANRCGHLATH